MWHAQTPWQRGNHPSSQCVHGLFHNIHFESCLAWFLPSNSEGLIVDKTGTNLTWQNRQDQIGPPKFWQWAGLLVSICGLQIAQNQRCRQLMVRVRAAVWLSSQQVNDAEKRHFASSGNNKPHLLSIWQNMTTWLFAELTSASSC